LGILGGLLLILFEAKLENYILGSIGGSFLGAILSTYNGRAFLKPRILSKVQFKDLMALSLPYIPTYLSNYLLQFIDRIIITSFFGLEVLGLYALINRIGSITLFALQIVSNGFRPIIFSNYQNPEGQLLGRRIFNFFWISLVPITVIVIVASKPVINLFGGSQYSHAVPILPYIVISVMFWGTFFLFGFGYQIRRRTSYITLITFGVVASVYLLSFPLIQLSGIAGVAQATFVSTMIGSILYIYISEKLFSFGYNIKLMVGSMIISTMILIMTG
jgi:O-antigen/teichoic acid export membrane protein